MKTILPTWLGSFYGSGFTFEEYESKTVEHFYFQRAESAKLFETRWFDYVRLHPMQATHYFFHCYRKISAQLSQKYFGKAVGSKYENFLDSRERGSFWTLRMFCDSIGCNYPWFLYTMMEYRLATGQFKNRLPRPQHLHPASKEEHEALRMTWDKKLAGELISHSLDPFFLVSQWEGDLAQLRHEELLVKQIKNKRVKHYVLSDLIYGKQLLRFETALKHFPDEMNDVLKNGERAIYS